MPQNPNSRPRSFPQKNITEETAASSYFSAKSLEQLQAQDQRQSVPRSFFFQLVLFSVPALIFEPIKLRQERALQSTIQGRETTAVIGQILKSADHMKTWSNLSDVLPAEH